MNTDFNKVIQKLEFYLQKQLPIIIATEALNFFKESFNKEGFTDENFQRWKEVKRRINPRFPDRADARRPILTGKTGELADSINFKIQANSIIFFSDKPYALAHNEGTTNAGRNHNVFIPKRQFVGPSKTLDNILSNIILNDIKKILNS